MKVNTNAYQLVKKSAQAKQTSKNHIEHTNSLCIFPQSYRIDIIIANKSIVPIFNTKKSVEMRLGFLTKAKSIINHVKIHSKR